MNDRSIVAALFKNGESHPDKLANPVQFALTFVNSNDKVDYFVVGVDSAEQLQDMLTSDSYNKKDIATFDVLPVDTDKQWFDPRNW